MSIASSVSSIGERTSLVTSAPTRRRSVAPAGAPNNVVAVKKTKAPASTATSRAAPRPSVSRVPSSYGSTGTVAKGKENDGMDALTSGLKRITIRMPSKEEYEAREKEKEEKKKAAEASKKAAAKTTTRKVPAARTSTTKAAATKPATAKKTTIRTTKSTKAEVPVGTKVNLSVPEAPLLERAVSAPLEKPQPVQAEPGFSLQQAILHQATTESPVLDLRASCDAAKGPGELRDMEMTPEQLREQLPTPPFVTMEEPMVPMPPLTRAETPPPPPPSSIPPFGSYTSQAFMTAPMAAPTAGNPTVVAGARSSTLPQWPPPNNGSVAHSNSENRPLSPASKRHDLPVFTAHGTIPFGSQANPVTSTSGTTLGSSLGQQGAGGEMHTKTEERTRDVWEVPDTPAH